MCSVVFSSLLFHLESVVISFGISHLGLKDRAHYIIKLWNSICYKQAQLYKFAVHLSAKGVSLRLLIAVHIAMRLYRVSAQATEGDSLE